MKQRQAINPAPQRESRSRSRSCLQGLPLDNNSGHYLRPSIVSTGRSSAARRRGREIKEYQSTGGEKDPYIIQSRYFIPDASSCNHQSVFHTEETAVWTGRPRCDFWLGETRLLASACIIRRHKRNRKARFHCFYFPFHGCPILNHTPLRPNTKGSRQRRTKGKTFHTPSESGQGKGGLKSESRSHCHSASASAIVRL